MKKIMRHNLKIVPFLIALIIGFNGIISAQDETAATILGQVIDSAGSIIPNANVVVKNTKTGQVRQVQTNATGNYVVFPLAPGRYEVSVEQTGFKKSIVNVTLNTKDRRPIDVVLDVGAASETVIVTSEPPLIQESPTGQGLVTGTQVVELPLNNRNFLKLTELIPGVSSSLDDESSFGLTSRADISINGNRRNGVNYLVDGVSNTDVGSNITLLSTPTIDSIQEFKILTSNYTADVGRSGGGTVTVTTRGGGNDFHGSLYIFNRNDRFSANSFFNNRRGNNADGTPIADVPKLRYNNFGGTFSGPVVVPGFGEATPFFKVLKDRTFFFFSEEARRIIRGTTDAGAIVPTAAQRDGNFSAFLAAPLYLQANGTSGTTVTANPLFVTDTNGQLIQAATGMIFRPGTNLAYAGNIIPQSELSPLAIGLANVYPLPNNGLNGFTSTPININNTRQETIRIDHVFNQNNRLFGRYTHDLSETEESGGLFNNILIPNISTTQTRVPGSTLAISYTSLLSSRITNEFAYNFSGNRIGSELTGRGRRSDYPNASNIPEAFPENNNDAIPALSFSGNGSPSFIGSLQGYNIVYRNNLFRDNLTWVIGNHIFKFGGEVSFESKGENAGNSTQGTFTFNNIPTLGTSGGVNLTQTGSSFASYLLGLPLQYQEDQFDVTVNLKFGRREFYAQDTYKILPNLTLDFGVRYQYYVPVRDDNNVLTSFLPSAYNAANVPVCTTAACAALVRGTGNELNGITIAGVNSPFGRNISPSDKNNFSPRVGLAWDPFEDGKTIVRAGYGLYYDQVLVGIFEQNSFVNPPFNNRAVYSGAGVTLANPTGGVLGALPIRGLIASAPDFETPEIQQYSVGIQREVFKNAVIDVSYVGTKGDKLIRDLDINQPRPADVLAVGIANRNRIRPFIGYSSIIFRETSAISRYNGLLSSFNYRFGNGFSLTTSYTFSKNLTDATNDRDAIDRPQNSQDKRVEYAEARTSRPHIFSASYVYEIPFFTRSENSALRLLLGGYQISGITVISSGAPVPRVVSDTGGEIRGNRPNLIGDPNGGLAGTLGTDGLPYIFDPTAFELPADGTFGNSPRSFARLPGQNQTNLSLSKNFYFNTEKTFKLQLRAESFNIFNHTQFTGIGASFSAPSTLGRPTSTRLPREFQFGAKLDF